MRCMQLSHKRRELEIYECKELLCVDYFVRQGKAAIGTHKRGIVSVDGWPKQNKCTNANNEKKKQFSRFPKRAQFVPSSPAGESSCWRAPTARSRDAAETAAFARWRARRCSCPWRRESGGGGWCVAPGISGGTGEWGTIDGLNGETEGKQQRAL
jgi:hypothetical protein